MDSDLQKYMVSRSHAKLLYSTSEERWKVGCLKGVLASCPLAPRLHVFLGLLRLCPAHLLFRAAAVRPAIDKRDLAQWHQGVRGSFVRKRYGVYLLFERGGHSHQHQRGARRQDVLTAIRMAVSASVSLDARPPGSDTLHSAISLTLWGHLLCSSRLAAQRARRSANDQDQRCVMARPTMRLRCPSALVPPVSLSALTFAVSRLSAGAQKHIHLQLPPPAGTQARLGWLLREPSSFGSIAGNIPRLYKRIWIWASWSKPSE